MRGGASASTELDCDDISRGKRPLPIIVTYLQKEREEEEGVQNSIGWNYKTANWDRYRKHAVWSSLPEDMMQWTNEDLISDLYERFYEPADDTIPVIEKTKFFLKP